MSVVDELIAIHDELLVGLRALLDRTTNPASRAKIAAHIAEEQATRDRYVAKKKAEHVCREPASQTSS
jgi:hypothetical protein